MTEVLKLIGVCVGTYAVLILVAVIQDWLNERFNS